MAKRSGFATGTAAGGIATAKKSLAKVIADYDAAKLVQVADVLGDALEFAIDRSPVDSGLYKSQWEIVVEPGGVKGSADAQTQLVLSKSQSARPGVTRADERLRLRGEWKKNEGFWPMTKEPGANAHPKAPLFFRLSEEYRARLRAVFSGVDGEAGRRVGEGKGAMRAMDAGKSNTVYLFNPSSYARFVESGNGKTKGARTGAKTRQYLNRRLKSLYIQRP